MSVLPSALLPLYLSPFGTISLTLESQFRYALQTTEEEVDISGKFNIVKYEMFGLAVNLLLFSLHIHCTSTILTLSEKRGERVRETEKGIVLVIPLIF
jgi:hypothetical protein